jgi:hypothetical protein
MNKISRARSTRYGIVNVLLLDTWHDITESRRACHIGTARAQNESDFGDRECG